MGFGTLVNDGGTQVSEEGVKPGAGNEVMMGDVCAENCRHRMR